MSVDETEAADETSEAELTVLQVQGYLAHKKQTPPLRTTTGP